MSPDFEGGATGRDWLSTIIIKHAVTAEVMVIIASKL